MNNAGEAEIDNTAAEVLWPRPALAGCIFGSFVRDTRNRPLEAAQRYNHFAASPYCGITWFWEGQAHQVDWPDGAANPASRPPLPHIIFHGPHRQPSTSWNPGTVFAMTTVLYADAIAALAGLDISTVVDRVLPVEDIFDGTLLLACKATLGAGTSVERLLRFETELEPLWQEARPSGHVVAHMVRDWTRAMALRAATSDTGRSLRQLERRIRKWAGQSLRGLSSSAHAEHAYAISLKQRAEGDINLARLAADAGFSDQSHMIRTVKRETGFTPAQLQDLIENDESFWSYRLLAKKF
jgi:AraC-like DNA-binding protein